MKTGTLAIAALVVGAVMGWAEEPAVREIVTALAQPVVQVPANAAERTEGVPALKYLPGKSEGVVAVARKEGTELGNALCEELGGEEGDGQGGGIGSAAVSFGVGTHESLRMLGEVATMVGDGRSFLNVLRGWMDGGALDEAEDEGDGEEDVAGTAPSQETTGRGQTGMAAQLRREIIGGVLERGEQAVKERVGQLMETLHVAPVYVVLTAQPGREELFARKGGEIIRKLTRVDSDGEEVEQVGDFRGVSVPLVNIFEKLLAQEWSDEQREKSLREGLAHKKVYVLSKQEPGVLYICVCQDPKEMCWPADETGSLAHAVELADMDAHARSMELFAWFSKELMTVGGEYNVGYRTPVFTLVQNIFDEYAKRDEANSSVYQAASRGVQSIARFLKSVPSYKDALSLQIWKEGWGYRMDLFFAPMGSVSVDGGLPHFSLAEDPQTSLYIESTGWTTPFKYDWTGMTDALLDITAGVVLTLNEEQKDTCAMFVSMAQMLRPEFSALEVQSRQLIDSLGGAVSLVIMEEKSSAAETQIHGALSCSVADKAALDNAWQGTMDTLKKMAAKLGQDPALLEQLPLIREELPDGANAFTLAIPLYSGRVRPHLVVAEKQLILADVPESARRLQAAGGGMPFSGSVVVARLDEMMPAGGANCAPTLAGTLYLVTTLQGERGRLSGLLQLKPGSSAR